MTEYLKKYKKLLKKNFEIIKEDEEILVYQGLGRAVSRILSYLQNAKEATSLDLERLLRLRQPEVSIAMKQLRKLGWINEREEKKPGKGRPFKLYSLKVGFNDIMAQLKNNREKR